jgi:hypothetical protein
VLDFECDGCVMLLFGDYHHTQVVEDEACDACDACDASFGKK